MCQRRQNSVMFVAGNGMLKFMASLIAEQVGRAEGHVGVAGEVAVDLDRVGEDGHPDGARSRSRPGSAKTGSASRAMRSAMASFLNRPSRKSCTPTLNRGQFQRLRRRTCGRKSLARTIGPATRCGKNRMNSRKWSQVALGRDLAAVDVHRVADRLERVERDADGQDDAQHRQRRRGAPAAARASLKRVEEEVGVLEVARAGRGCIDEADSQEQLRARPATGSRPCRGRSGSRQTDDVANDQRQPLAFQLAVEVEAGDEQQPDARARARAWPSRRRRRPGRRRGTSACRRA